MHWLRTTAIIGCMAALAPAAGAPRHAAPARAHANPFAAPSTLPFQAPPFDRIKDSDYQPGLRAGMAEQSAEIARDRQQPGGADLRQHDRRDGAVGPDARPASTTPSSAVVQANTNDALDKVQTDDGARSSPRTSDAIYLNPKLFARVKALYDKRDTAAASIAESMQLLEALLRAVRPCRRQAVRADKAKLRGDQQAKMPASRPPSSRSCSPAPRPARWSSTTRRKLAGLSDDEIAAAAQAAEDAQA